MKRKWLGLSLYALLLAGCGGGGGGGGGGGDNNGNPPMTSIDQVPSPPQSATQGPNVSTSSSVVIGPAGGTIQIPNLGSATLPPSFVPGSKAK